MTQTYYQRTEQDVQASVHILHAFEAAGLELFPLKVGAKTPRDIGWRWTPYRRMNWAAHLRRGGNVGVRARDKDIFVDVDPRNGGLESLGWLQDLSGIDLGHLLRVDSGRGDGGHHLYATVPVGERIRTKLAGFPGIDFKRIGGYVVAPGSLHPTTGKPYVFRGTVPILIPPAPPALIALLQRPPRPARTGNGGRISCGQLGTLLSALDPSDFGQGSRYHEQWLDIAMACHDGTNGEGLAEWLEWCAGDPCYGEEARSANEARWDSFQSGNPMGITVRTLYRAVVRAGRPALVARLDKAADDFADEVGDLLVYDAEEADDLLVYKAAEG